MRVALGVAMAALGVGVAALAACGGCGKSSPGGGASSAASASGVTSAPAGALATKAGGEPPSTRDPAMWSRAENGDEEDLATLAAHEGAAGLVEGAGETVTQRLTAIRAMGYARGWAQLPFLSKAAAGADAGEARAALESVVMLAERPLRAEDPEDAEELRDGCDRLVALARDPARERERRILAIRALRMMTSSCWKADASPELPTDLDTK